MAISVQTSLDTSAFTARLEYASKEGLQAIRAGVNAAAVIAKRDFIKAVVPDAAGKGINAAAVRAQTTAIRRASVANLSASFIVSNKSF
jgi:hypothetical protein